MSVFDKVMTEFHAHLDGCPQCEQHPFDLCPEGQKIMDGAFVKEPTRYWCTCDECHPELHFGKDS